MHQSPNDPEANGEALRRSSAFLVDESLGFLFPAALRAPPRSAWPTTWRTGRAAPPSSPPGAW
ncbi:hypothetical protein [Kitasatospora sp. MMS16-BH015]|uniref:hypothetical protein n=1 Tax=Kitasatospora sp. MMS16-BH015 TaxID=2018025 RepID=UPI00352DCA4D